jgi:hypothetical protein
MKVVMNWLLFLGFIAAVAVLFAHREWIIDKMPAVPQMTGLQVLVFSLACAFAWVDVLKWGVSKPFTCLKCMTGWISVLFAFSHHVEFWPLYLPLGLFAGAVFSAIKMRYL